MLLHKTSGGRELSNLDENLKEKISLQKQESEVGGINALKILTPTVWYK